VGVGVRRRAAPSRGGARRRSRRDRAHRLDRCRICRPSRSSTSWTFSLTAHGGPYWADQLAFGDALRTSPSLRRRYGALKRQLATEHDEPQSYTRAKTSLIRQAQLAVGHTPLSGWAAEPAAPADAQPGRATNPLPQFIRL
jgi:GrpB-like predicted nucleotidyltransferase (UPF0157 family)